ncbi:copper resistance CopC family protein [Streptosporangium sp. NPDC006007]|uniref:copper resistance CopC family protein n=1 Tax=Streptosporangium sp. NPDC006007 TaxID=3154575 RepID=UPI0033A7C1D1
MKTSPVAVVLALLVTLVLGTAFASPALAHDTLQSSDPAKGVQVESLREVRLTFTAKIRFPAVVVRTSDNTAYQDGKPAVDGRVVTQRVKGDLPPGGYVIAYRVVSSDGHPIEGEIPFTLTAAPSPSGTGAPSSDPSNLSEPSAEPVPAASESAGPPAAAAQGSDQPESSGVVPSWMWLIVGGVTGVGIGLFFSMRNKRQQP